MKSRNRWSWAKNHMRNFMH